VHTDGSDIKGQTHLGAAVIHVLTCITIYIDARGIEETRTVMRAELVAIYGPRLICHKLMGGDLYGFSIQFAGHSTPLHSPRAEQPQHYHHHLLLLRGITDLLEERRRRGLRTILHKIRSHTNIRGNDLADAAAKMVVTEYDSLPESRKLKVDVREVPQHPPD
jgi:hypothetical protein